MHKDNLLKTVKNCISILGKLQQILDQESQFLKHNQLEKVADLNDHKMSTLKQYTGLRDQVCQDLKISRKYYHQPTIEDQIKKNFSEHDTQLLDNIEQLWRDQHCCRNQLIINQNIISARMQFLNKPSSQLTVSMQKGRLLYAKIDTQDYYESVAGKLTL